MGIAMNKYTFLLTLIFSLHSLVAMDKTHDGAAAPAASAPSVFHSAGARDRRVLDPRADAAYADRAQPQSPHAFRRLEPRAGAQPRSRYAFAQSDTLDLTDFACIDEAFSMRSQKPAADPDSHAAAAVDDCEEGSESDDDPFSAEAKLDDAIGWARQFSLYILYPELGTYDVVMREFKAQCEGADLLFLRECQQRIRLIKRDSLRVAKIIQKTTPDEDLGVPRVSDLGALIERIDFVFSFGVRAVNEEIARRFSTEARGMHRSFRVHDLAEPARADGETVGVAESKGSDTPSVSIPHQARDSAETASTPVAQAAADAAAPRSVADQLAEYDVDPEDPDVMTLFSLIVYPEVIGSDEAVAEYFGDKARRLSRSDLKRFWSYACHQQSKNLDDFAEAISITPMPNIGIEPLREKDAVKRSVFRVFEIGKGTIKQVMMERGVWRDEFEMEPKPAVEEPKGP